MASCASADPAEVASPLEEAGVTSRVTYSTRPSQSGHFADAAAYRTAFDELMAASPDPAGHCTDTEVPVWTGVSNRGTCGGTGVNFASRTRVELSVPPSLAGTWQIVVRPDYGLGGAVLFDGAEIGFNPGDMWEGLGQVFGMTVMVTPGLHVLEAYGVENCCDGQNSGFYQPPGGALQPFVTTPTPPCPTEGYAPSCTPRCRALVVAANAISDRALQGATHFTRDEYLTLFDAVECRTGVPASVLKTIAVSEALGTFYEDPYPRHFIEPCDQVWNTNGWGYPQLFSRYFGVNGWPLLAFDPPSVFQCSTARDATCSCPPSAPIQRVIPPAPPQAGRPPHSCALAAPTNAEWPALWPSIVHVTIGDDRPTSQSFGLGIMQTTFLISNIVQPVGAGRATYVNRCWPASLGPIYPVGASPAPQSVPLDPLPDLFAVARDPQFNILLAAEMILYKAEFEDVNDVRDDVRDVVSKLPSDRYGMTLAAGTRAPHTLTGTGSWAFQGAQYKTTNSCTTTLCVQEYIESVLTFPADATRDAPCFRPSPLRETSAAGTSCLYPIAHRFATEQAP